MCRLVVSASRHVSVPPDVTLHQVASRDPATTEEEEFVENVFDVLASCLLLPENKTVFVEAEGARAVLHCLAAVRGFTWFALS